MKIIKTIFSYLFMAVFITIWSGLTLMIDIKLVHSVIMDARASNWSTTQGRIVASGVIEGRRCYAPSVRYQYHVDGREYEGKRIRFAMDMHGKRSSERAVRPFPRGSDVIVHYNSNDPSQSTLRADIVSGGNLYVAIFATPFNLVMLVCWFVAYHLIRGERGPKGPAGDAVILVEDERGVRVRLSRMGPLTAAGLRAGIAAFAMCILIGLVFGGGDLIAPAVVAWAVVGYVAIRGYRAMKSRIEGGWYDLVLDEAALIVALPRCLRAYGGTQVPYDLIQRVEVLSTRGKGGQSNRVKLWWNDAEVKSVVLIDASVRELAEAFAGWLRKRLVLESPSDAATDASQPSTVGSCHG